VSTLIDLAPLADAAADYRHAVARLDAAAGDAEEAWKLLPAALDSPGTQVAVGAYVGPAHQLSTALLGAADDLHATLLGAAAPLRALSVQADAHPDVPDWSRRLDAAESDCAATIVAIRGGEAGSVDLPRPTPRAPAGGSRAMRPASFVMPIAPTLPTMPWLGGVLDAGGTAAGAAAAGLGAGLLGVLGLVLGMSGSTDSRAAAPRDNRPPRKGIDQVRITPYTPCNPLDHGPGCQNRHLLVEKPGDEPFTGDKVRGDEEPGEMPGTQSNWVKRKADNGKGWVYESPDGRSMRVMEPRADQRYPNGYVEFQNKYGQRVDLYWKTHPKTSDEVHIVRNPDGSFPMPKGWNQ
jgi:hypothetical protein